MPFLTIRIGQCWLDGGSTISKGLLFLYGEEVEAANKLFKMDWRSTLEDKNITRELMNEFGQLERKERGCLLRGKN